MPTITQDMRQIIDDAKLAFVATVCSDGSPNLSPKGSLRVYDDDHLVFMDIASPNTMSNLEADPRIEVNVIDVFRRRGYRFKGTASIVPPGHPAYEWLNDWLLEANDPWRPWWPRLLLQTRFVGVARAVAQDHRPFVLATSNG